MSGSGVLCIPARAWSEANACIGVVENHVIALHNVGANHSAIVAIVVDANTERVRLCATQRVKSGVAVAGH